MTSNRLINAADRALDQAKRQGRDRIIINNDINIVDINIEPEKWGITHQAQNC